MIASFYFPTLPQLLCYTLGSYTFPSLGLIGACPPFVVHSHMSENKKTIDEDIECKLQYTAEENIYVNPRFTVGLSDPDAGPNDYFEHRNPCGFTIRSTKNGSMTQETFFDYCVHFVKWKQLQSDETTHILFLDGHSSRWNLAALQYLMTNEVYPFFLPSHTSIWTQPNDNGPNLRFHKCVDNVLRRIRNNGSKNTVWFYNTVIRHAWTDFVQREREELLNTGYNTTTNSWKNRVLPFQSKSRILE